MGVHQRSTDGEDGDTAVTIAADSTQSCATPEKKEGLPQYRLPSSIGLLSGADS